MFRRVYHHGRKRLWRKRLFVWRRFRSAWFRWEWHNHDGVRYVAVHIGHPRKHTWWATGVTYYLTYGPKHS